MSAYAEYNVAFTDREALIEALKEMPTLSKIAITSENLIVGKGLPLYGYRGDNRMLASGRNRAPACEVVIPGAKRPGHANLVGGAANDIGFTRTDAGLIPVISEYDSSFYNQKWLNALKTKYAETVITAKAKAKGYSVSKVEKDGKIVMSLTRFRM